MFVDESYLGDHSAKIQTVLTIPDRIYNGFVVPECRRILRNLGGASIKEFKGKEIKRSNISHYRELTQLFVKTAMGVAMASPMRTVIAFDGKRTDIEGLGDDLMSILEQRLRGNELGKCKKSIRDFLHQFAWLIDNSTAIASEPFANLVVIEFDDKYDNARNMSTPCQLFNSDSDKPQAARLDEVLTDAVNRISRVLRISKDIFIPKLQKLTCVPSEEEFGIQGADVLANLYHNYIRSEMGDTSSLTQLKREMLEGCIPNIGLTGNVRMACSKVNPTVSGGKSSFSVKLNDGHEGLKVIIGPPTEESFRNHPDRDELLRLLNSSNREQ